MALSKADSVGPANPKVYLALGDSMSIDLYTGVEGGGAVSQFYRNLQARRHGEPSARGCWRLDDRTFDGCTIEGVARLLPLLPLPPADLVTMTVGGNDLLQNMHRDPAESLPEFEKGYNALLDQLAECTTGAIVVAGNIYHPQAEFPIESGLDRAIDRANQIIADAIAAHVFHLADIHAVFRGHEQEYLCLGIEPTLKSAIVIADLFERAAFGA